MNRVMNRFFVRFLVPSACLGLGLGLATIGGCSSKESLGVLDDGSALGAGDGGGTDSASPSSSSDATVTPDGSSTPSSECVQNGGTCEVDDGTALTDPCTGTGRGIRSLACPGASSDSGQVLCCVPQPFPLTECANHGGTCEYDDGTAEVDPCTGTLRPIGEFACGAKPAQGEFFCCLPK